MSWGGTIPPASEIPQTLLRHPRVDGSGILLAHRLERGTHPGTILLVGKTELVVRPLRVPCLDPEGSCAECRRRRGFDRFPSDTDLSGIRMLWSFQLILEEHGKCKPSADQEEED